MRIVLFLFSISFLLSSSTDCKPKKNKEIIYSAILEDKGICSNYTIRLLSPLPDSSLVMQNWKNEVNGKTYTNVFAPENPCSIPSGYYKGQSFKFIILPSTIEKAKVEECMVCMAYYPKPGKKIPIRVIK